MNISNNQFLSIEQLQEQYLKQQKKIQPAKTAGGSALKRFYRSNRLAKSNFQNMLRTD